MESLSAVVDIFATYLSRVAPGIVLGAVTLLLVRREPRLRIVVYLSLFVLFRDTMTPLGLWSFGREGFFWIRLYPDPAFLIMFGIACLGLSLCLYYFDKYNRPLLQWRRSNVPLGLSLGLVGAIVAVAPLIAIYRYTPIESRGGPVPVHDVPAIFVVALLGNLLEETLFRGYVYGYLALTMAPIQAGISSGIVFAFCHIFLATTVTGIGYPLLVFTLWEGIIAGIVGAKCGVLPATLTHGGAIFILSSGLI